MKDVEKKLDEVQWIYGGWWGFALVFCLALGIAPAGVAAPWWTIRARTQVQEKVIVPDSLMFPWLNEARKLPPPAPKPKHKDSVQVLPYPRIDTTGDTIRAW